MAFCNKCGTEINEGAVFCPGCGTPVVTQNNTVNQHQSNNTQQYYQSNQNYQQQSYQSQQNYQPYQNYQQGYQQQNFNQQMTHIDTTGIMIWSIINLLFCWPLSIVSLINLNKVNKAPTMEEGYRILNSAKTMCIIATVVGILCFIIALSM